MEILLTNVNVSYKRVTSPFSELRLFLLLFKNNQLKIMHIPPPWLWSTGQCRRPRCKLSSGDSGAVSEAPGAPWRSHALRQWWRAAGHSFTGGELLPWGAWSLRASCQRHGFYIFEGGRTEGKFDLRSNELQAWLARSPEEFWNGIKLSQVQMCGWQTQRRGEAGWAREAQDTFLKSNLEKSEGRGKEGRMFDPEF